MRLKASSECVCATHIILVNEVRFGFTEYVDEDEEIQKAVQVAEHIGTVIACMGHPGVSFCGFPCNASLASGVQD